MSGCYSGLNGFDRGSGQDGGETDASGDAGESEGETEGVGDELDPGRVTMHRLTNAEYDNTISDVFFGLPLEPSSVFPADEVSLGFDNISDVLSVTPVLFELYERSAEQAIELALTSTGGGGEVERHEAEDVGGTSGQPCCGGGFWALSSNGEIATTMSLATGGEHEIVVRAYGQQAGADLPHMTISVDGVAISEIDVTATSDAPAEHTVVTEIPAGNHTVTVAFTNDFYDAAAGLDRNLYVDYIELRSLVAPTDSIRDRILTCEPAPGQEAACADEILRAMGKRAWRRPLTDEEVEGLVAIVQTALIDGQSFEQGIALGLQALLISPYFLFRVEIDPDPTSLVPHPLNDYELASRLSYFVWSTMPDDELMALADEGMLSNPVVIEGQVQRMLQNERADALVKNFAGQWLYLRNIEAVVKDYEAYPDFDSELQASMRTEAELFFQTFVTEGRSLTELLTAEETFVDARLAEHYGLPAPAGEGFERVSLAGMPRRGLLTQPGIMSVLSHPVTTSPVKRGKWVLEQLMCIHPPPPPPGVEIPPLDPEIGGTMREQLAQHRNDPSCAACHSMMDPIGLGLEHYDAVGRYRDVDAGMEIDASGNLPTGEAFTNGLEMVALLADSDDFAYCTTRKTLTYALGRDPGVSDIPYVDEIIAEMQARDMTLEGLLVAIATNDVFRMRRGEQ
ncbi:DUF1592 domain-containing protein [Paraliomyxa miuraensis]|uniref:DUF1592 domain-containing protein n=1 Tax=Paraliomyxa miuraensis TaxID=376150 RepID=UPI0022567A33|nr:DUF1592 domain-containing protein [Paraliomyxa miuraensis]MCX4240641.1 DUF1592 domain-containing protein [Paraliomyxa miuraensis]